MEESTAGEPAAVKISDLVDYNGRLHVIFNGTAIELKKPIKVNGKAEAEDYQIQEDDSVSLYAYYTYEQIMEYLNLNEKEVELLVNEVKVGKDIVIYDNDVIKTQAISKKASVTQETTITAEQEVTVSEEKKDTVHVFRDMIVDAAKEETEQKEEARLVVIVNQKPVVLEGRDIYRFVDIFDYIDFDTSKMRGNGIVTKVNGEKAQYTQELKNGDKVEIYWN